MAAATSSPARAESGPRACAARPRRARGTGAARRLALAREDLQSLQSLQSLRRRRRDGDTRRERRHRSAERRSERVGAARGGGAAAGGGARRRAARTVLSRPGRPGLGDTIEKRKGGVSRSSGSHPHVVRLASMPPRPRAARARPPRRSVRRRRRRGRAASFAVLAQTLECDGARVALVLSSPLLALPLAPIAGAVALPRRARARGRGHLRRSARAARAYAAWTMDAAAAAAVALAATALARSGVDALGSRWGPGGRFGARSADGAAWFVPPLAAAVVKLAAAAAAARGGPGREGRGGERRRGRPRRGFVALDI